MSGLTTAGAGAGSGPPVTIPPPVPPSGPPKPPPIPPEGPKPPPVPPVVPPKLPEKPEGPEKPVGPQEKKPEEPAKPKNPPEKKPEEPKKPKEPRKPEAEPKDPGETPPKEKKPETEPEPPKTEPKKPPVKKKKEGYLAGLWRRTKGGLKAAAGAVAATAQAAKDLYNDKELRENTWKNIKEELKETADEAAKLGKKAFDAAKHMVTHPKETLKTAGKALSSAAKTVAGVAKDIYKNPEIIFDTAKGTIRDIDHGTKVIGHAIKETLSDPDKTVDLIKTLTGFSDIEKSIETNRSLPSRLGHAVLGWAQVIGLAQAAKGVTGLKGAGALGSSADDAARLAATAAESSADDVGRVIVTKADDAVAAATKADEAVAAASKADDAVAAASKVDDAAAAATKADDAAAAVSKADDVAAAGSKVDDAAAAGSKADDVAAAGSKADDAVGAASKSDDAAGVASKTDDAAGAVSKSDDAAGVASKTDDAAGAASKTDDAAAASKADDAAGLEKTAETPREPRPDDFVEAPDVPPDTGGYTKSSQKAIQKVADEEGVQVITRPSSKHASKLLENGEAVPKPIYIKNKTANELDTMLGLSDDAVGKAAHFDPKLPPDEVLDAMSPEMRTKVIERYEMRKWEYQVQMDHIIEQGGAVHVKDGVIYDNLTGKPFAGDVDVFAIRDMHGNPISPEKAQRVLAKLKRAGANVRHGAHENWDMSMLTPEEREVAEAIDRSIRHRHTVDGGEALVRYQPGSKTPGSVHLADHAAGTGG